MLLQENKPDTEKMVDDLNSLTDKIKSLIKEYERKYPVHVKEVNIEHGIYSRKRIFTNDVNLTVEVNKVHKNDL